MHIHNVYFWLKSRLDDEGKNSFEKGLKALCNEPNTKSGFFGKPAETLRDVVENSYDYGLVLFFDDLSDHDRYQKTSPVHTKFIEDHHSKWKRVVVYDIET